MRLSSIVQRLAAIGGGLTLLGMGMVPVASADAPSGFPGGLPPFAEKATLTQVIITDSGFDKPSYEVVGTANSTQANVGRIQFINKGTRVHNATTQPGTYGPASFIEAVDGSGNHVNCDVISLLSYSAVACGRLGNLDTGGIDVGGSVTIGLGSGARGGGGGKAVSPFATGPDDNTWRFTSATDCLGGNSTPGFNCTPSSAVLRSPRGVTSVFGGGSVYGSVFGTTDNPDCAVGTTQGTRCFLPYRQYLTLQGTLAKPLDSVTITVDDIKGYQPTFAYVKMGGTITWKNIGQMPHSLTNYAPTFPIWGSPFAGVGSGNNTNGQNAGIVLNPGDTFTWNSGPPPYQLVAETTEAPVCATCKVTFVGQFLRSTILTDVIPPKAAGTAGAGVGTNLAGGIPGMNSILYMVATS
jgi:hypothetical protein